MNRADSLLGHCLGVVIGKARDTEVGHLDCAVLQKHNVMRLDITVNYALVVSVLERLENLGGEVQSLSPIENSLLTDVLLECNSVDILHYDILNHIAEAYVIYLYNIGVREHSDCLALVLESSDKFLVV